MTPLEKIIAQLTDCKKTGSNKYQAICPAHDDVMASLSIEEKKDGTVLLHCHAGCETEAILQAIGLEMKDLFSPNAKRTIECTYDYTDEQGQLLYQVVRFIPKDFRQRRPDPSAEDGYRWSIKGIRKVLYHLPEVIQAVEEGQTIYLCEGEKDSDNLRKIGLVATTNAGGAKNWTKSLSEQLKAAQVVILLDNDDPGRERGEKLFNELKNIAASVQMLELPELKEKGDVSDWLKAGGTKEQLIELADQAPTGEEWLKRNDPLEMARATIKDMKDWTAEEIFNDQVIGALAIIKDSSYTEYAKIKGELKGRINLNDIEKSVNLVLAEKRNIHVVQPDEKPPGLNQVLPDFPLENLITPGDWSIDQRGVKRYDPQKNTMIRACMVPVVLTERLVNIENEKEKMTVSFYRYGKWHSITASSSTLFNHSSIVQLRDRGLPVSSTESKEMVKYLTDFESANLNLLPVRQSVHHLGWVKEGQAFLPGAGGDIVLDIDDDGSSSIAQHYHPSGELEDWIKTVTPLREYPVARFILAAGFASPLMSLIGQRVFLLHCWGGSRGGKTAAMKSAVSIWGNPEAIMASFNATKTGLENMASLYSDLPLLIDERQVAGKNQEEIETLVYTLSMGKSKARGNKGGGLQQFATWKSIILMNGEHPLTNQSSATGVRTRTLELYGRVIPDEEYAGNLHRLLEKYYGTAGPEFITRVIEELKANPNVFEDDYNLIYQALKEKYGDKAASHLAYVSTVVIGDYYSSIWIFKLEEEEAFKQAIELGSHILQQLESSEDMNEAARAYEYVLSWYEINKAFFKEDPPGGRRYGLGETEGYLWIYPPIFNEAMDNAGFNYDRILKDWDEMELIKTHTRGGKRYRRGLKYDPDAKKQLPFIAVLLSRDKEEPESLF